MTNDLEITAPPLTVPDISTADREHRLRRRQLMASIGQGMAALANIGSVMKGAPAAPTPAHDISQRIEALHNAEAARADRRNTAQASMALQKWRAKTDLDLRTRRELRADKAEERQQAEADDRATSRAMSREQAERRTKLAEDRQTERQQQANAPAKAEAPGSSSSRRSGAQFVWVHPDTGERYTIGRDTWAKSSVTLFQMVADATRPKPDSRGYPTVEQWRHHCFDTYYESGRRDAYIMRHLPEAPRALEYLKRLK